MPMPKPADTKIADKQIKLYYILYMNNVSKTLAGDRNYADKDNRLH